MDISNIIENLRKKYGDDLVTVIFNDLSGYAYYENDEDNFIVEWGNLDELSKFIKEETDEEEFKSYCCYKVKCKTVKENKNLTRATWMVGDDNLECKSGNVYIITDDPRTIYDTFEDVISIKNIGVGYTITNEGI